MVRNKNDPTNGNGYRTEDNKEAVLKALKKHKGLISYACEEGNIARRTYYDWLADDPAFKEATKDIQERALDAVEKSAHRIMLDKKNPNPTMIIFYLKTKGRSRGFIEKHEVEHNVQNIEEVRKLISKIKDDNLKDY